MTVAVQQPREKESDMDQILKGLLIAEKAYGIYDAGERRKALEEANKLEKERQGKMDQFTIDKHKQDVDIEIAKNFKDVPEGTPGALLIPDSSGGKRFLLPREKPADAVKFTESSPYQDDNGNWRRGAFNPSTGKTIKSPDDPVVAAPAGSGAKTFTQDQSKSAIVAKSIEDAEATMDSLLAEGFDPTSWNTKVQKGASQIPLIGGIFEEKKSQSLKRFESAQATVADMINRYLSGQNVTEPERQRKIQEVMPEIGDGPDVLADKKRKRQIFYEGVKVAAGDAYNAGNTQGQSISKTTAPRQTSGGTANAAPVLNNDAIDAFIQKNKK